MSEPASTASDDSFGTPAEGAEMGAIAIVTGGGGSIGSAIGAQLAHDGYEVMLADIREQAAETAANAVRLAGGAAHARPLDVRSRAQMQQLVREATSTFGPIKVLVNAAGGHEQLGLKARPFHETSADEWDLGIGVNLLGTFNCTHTVIPQMMEQRDGVIINLSSGHGIRGAPTGVGTLSVYAAAKAGIIAFSRAIAVELGPYGIRVNCVAPGRTAAWWKEADPDAPGRQAQGIPLGKLASPADIGHAVAFLVSDRASHITGVCLDVSGGTTLH
jgi:NAD(P)-dependent dehydrogenase (short-subunit alcohol dehydrogenase family)